MKKSEILIFCCLAFIIGIGFGLAYSLEIFFVYISFLAVLVSLAVFWKNINLRILFFGILFLFLGILRCRVQVCLYPTVEVYGEKIKMQGIILDEPENSYITQRFAFDAGEINLTSLKLNKYIAPIQALTPPFPPSRGELGDSVLAENIRILVNANLYPKYYYGDELEIECKLQKPEPFGNFRYDEYLELDRITALCYYPQISVLKRDQGNAFFAGILKSKRKFNEIIAMNVDEPQASIISAILLGNKYGISAELKEIFSRAGISHILAVSGMHIGILGIMILFILNFVGISRKKAFYFSCALIILYVLMIGWPASAVRAAVMGIILMSALQFGRLGKFLNVVFIAACLMLLLKPGLLFYDIGFQLSFSAILGIYFLYPGVKKLLLNFSLLCKERLCEVSFAVETRHASSMLEAIINILSISLAAEIFILPLAIYYFGLFSVVAPFANLAVIWLVPFIMAFGIILIIAGLASFLIPILSLLAKIIGAIVSFLLGYFAFSAKFMTSFSWSALEIKNFPLWGVVFCYAVIGFLVLWSNRSYSNRERM